MMYPYIKFEEETEVTFFPIIIKENIKTIQVYFERPTESGVDLARCELPSYKWVKNEGYSEKEIEEFKDIISCFIPKLNICSHSSAG